MPNNKTSPKGSALWSSIATSYPEVSEMPSCTKIAYKAGGKSFLFLGTGDGDYEIMVKLGDSRKEAEAMAAEHPDKVHVGPHWITATFKERQRLSKKLVERWIGESFRLCAPKKLIAP